MRVIILEDEESRREELEGFFYEQKISVAAFGTVHDFIMGLLEDSLRHYNKEPKRECKLALLDLRLCKQDGLSEQLYQGRDAAEMARQLRPDIGLVCISSDEPRDSVMKLFDLCVGKLEVCESEKIKKLI